MKKLFYRPGSINPEKRLSLARIIGISSLVIILSLLLIGHTHGLSLVYPPNPVNNSVGLEGTIPSPPPSQGATILTPSNGQVFTNIPITVSGLCPTGLVVYIYSNNVFLGAAECINGSYTLNVDLFNGTNNLTAIDYDALNQAGPTSATTTVTFNSAQFQSFGTLLSISSQYAKRGANPGQVLTWPIIINGGTGPYAISVNWGDGQPAELLSQQFAGSVTISHTYNSSGTYTVTIKATDANGEEAYLQLIGVANGAVSQSNSSQNSKSNTITKTKVIWWPAVVAIPLIFFAFWMGRRYENTSLRKRLDNERRS